MSSEVRPPVDQEATMEFSEDDIEALASTVRSGVREGLKPLVDFAEIMKKATELRQKLTEKGIIPKTDE